MTLLGSVGGAVFGLAALRPAYVSSAGVLVQPVSSTGRPAEPASTELMGTERELVSADGVAEIVRQRTGWHGSLDDLRHPLSVSLQGGPQILRIAYRADDPERARQGAQTFASAYLEYRSRLTAQTLEGSRRNVEAALRQAAERAARLRAQVRTDAAGGQAANDGLLNEAAPYQASLAELAAVDTSRTGTVVEPAGLPSSPSGAGATAASGVGALLGLVTGLAIAWLRRMLDRRVRGRSDLEAQLGAPLLATVPRTRRQGPEESALVTVAAPDGPAAEAYRRLRARILAMADRSDLKTVMVASATAEPSTPAIAANLAVSMAATGRRVALVSADLRTPELHHYFGMDNDRGLSNVLTGEYAPAEAAQEQPGLGTLQVLTSGPPVAEPTELLAAGPLRVVLDERRGAADFVVVEAPPALSAAESLTLAPIVDGIVVVADARHATREELAEVGDQLRLVGGNVVGAVLCNAG